MLAFVHELSMRRSFSSIRRHYCHNLTRHHQPSFDAAPASLTRAATTVMSDTPADLPSALPAIRDPETSALLARISHLESQLITTTAQLRAALNSTPEPSPKSTKPSKKPSRPFQGSRFNTRLIALKIAYIGSHYNGYEHANNNITPKPTVEEVLWKALRKTRLIFPEIGQGCDDTFDVVWDEKKRYQRYITGNGRELVGDEDRAKLDVTWDGCEYSKCGRTDRGVSAFGQVVGIRVRSNRPKPKAQPEPEVEHVDEQVNGHLEDNQIADSPIPDLPSSPDLTAPSASEVSFSDADELPYIQLLNAVLPLSMRILAWCPHPGPDFDARFSCRERRYKYFFTNPAFLPTPGPLGLTQAGGRSRRAREGWLNIDKMREAAAKLVGSHDYRNLCKADPSKQMSSCVRRITHAGIDEWSAPGAEFSRNPHLTADGADGIQTMARQMGIGSFVDEGPRVYTFSVHGSAFLWHQVRCMVAILFLVGQGLEEPSIIDELLDVKSNPGKPNYEMADDSPLVLWECMFDGDDEVSAGGLKWLYPGDSNSLGASTAKHDGRFGSGSLLDSLWSQWRKAKMDEIVAGSLLDLTLAQGDGTALLRGGFRDPSTAKQSQKFFNGIEARVSGPHHVLVMHRPRLATLEEQNERYRNGSRGHTLRNSSQADIANGE
jgi:tRNA pseudouridine38/39 synthase